jgi:photosystem II stability/assembly factor-like uncharacterized protein
MNTTSGDARLNPRARRAILLILAAVLVTAGTSVVYLKPSLMPHSPPAKAVGPALVSNDYLRTFSFLTPSLGWALVAEQTIATPRFSVFKTTDAAKHWKRQFIRQLNQAGLESFNVQFFDPSHGVIAIGSPTEIYRTSDGGAHWALVKTPNYLHLSFAPADPVHGWLLGWTSQPNESVPNLYSTSDGGDTWTALPQIGDRMDGSLSFRNPREGWFGTSAAQPTVYTSTDGGVSWQPHTLPSNLDPNLCPTTPAGALGPFSTYVILLPGHGVVAISRNDYCGQIEGYTSVDGGATWRAVASPSGAPSLWRLAFQDSSHWWAMPYGELWKSADAGLSWKLFSQQLDGWEYIPHIIDADHAWAERPPGQGLAVTSDGGLHWSQVSSPKPG